MARHCRFSSSRFLSSFVLVATFYSFGLSRAAWPQSVPNQSPQTPASSGSAVQAAAPATFLVAPTVALSGAPSSVAAGDLNGDGKLDLVIANFDAGKISVLLGQGNGQFAAAVDYPVGKNPSFVLTGDVNGDGKLDVVVCNEADGTVSILLGNGDGSLQNPTTYKAAPDPVYVAMGDFNADGKPDLAVAGSSSGTVTLLLNDGTGNFSKAVPYTIGRAPQSLTVADFDGDGVPDLASANADGTINIMLSRGDGTFRAISSLSVASTSLSSIVSGDFNGDGKTDLAITQAGTKLLTVLLGRGDGTFQTGSPYAVGSNPAFVVTADVNNDNIPDLITANQSGNTFSVLLGNGDGTFKPSMDFVAGNSPRALAAGDFNADGHPDLAIVNFSDHSISVALGIGDGTFKAARAYNVDLDRKSVAAGDLDGDGKPDLVVTNFCGTDATCSSNGTVSVLLAVGDGTYKFAASYQLGAGPLSVALADVNGDKKLDLVAVNRGDKSVSVLLGNGDGTFQSGLTYSAGNSPVSVAVGDFNKDGKPDLAIAGDCGSSACAQPGNVSVLLGNGDGSFQSVATYPVGYSPSSIVAGDVNGDGNLDLAVSNACGNDSSCQSKGTATVLLGNGKGAFTSAADVVLGNSPSAVTLGDLNGDGMPDLVAAYRADNKVGVLLGNGDGTFKQQVAYQVGTAPSAVVVADFNGDGKRDVAVANFKDSKVSVLFGNGDGSLQTAVHYPVGVGPESLVAIDPTNSGHADLVSANGNGGLSPKGSDVTVLRNLKADDGTHPDTISVANTSGNPTSTYGDSVTFLATLTGDGSGMKFMGTVEFTDNSAQFDLQCNAVTPQPTGDPNVYTATCTTVLLPANSPSGAPITASLKNDPYYQGNTSPPITQTVNLATPGFNGLSSPSIPYGTSSTPLSGQIFATSTDGQNRKVYPPMGDSVTVTVQGQPAQTATINDNTGDFSVNYPTGTINVNKGPAYTITYHYAGDSNFNAIVPDGMGMLTVTQAMPTFSVTQPAPIAYGTPSITLTGKLCVTGSSPPVCPPVNDVVTITIQGQPAQTTTINDNTGDFTVNYPTATISVSGSPYQIKYSFAGDNNNFGAAKDDTSTSLTVSAAQPQFSVTQPAPITYGTSSITLSGAICVPGGACPPAGEQVTITINNVALPVTLGANGAFSASFDTHALDVGSYMITYDYNLNGADQNFKSATDTSTTLKVTQATPAFSGLSSPTITYGTASVTLKGSLCVAGSSPPVCPPVGDMVTITVQGQPPKMTSITDGTGDFSVDMYPTSTLAAGSYPIQYSFAGDGKNFKAAPDGSGTLTVSPATPTFSVTQPAPIPYGTASITLTGTICVTGSSPPVCPPAPEQITITINNVALPVTLGANGAFSTPFDTHAIPVSVSPYTITYTYNNPSDQNFTSATDTSTTLTVNQATTTVSLSGPSSSSFGQLVTFSVTVTPQFPGTGPPTGTVNYTINGAKIQDCTGLQLANGLVPDCNTTTLPLGVNQTIVATYSGDLNFQGNSASISPYTVTPATTNTALSADPAPGSVYLQPVTFTAKVTVTSGGNGSPTGSVTFTDGATGICPPVKLVLLQGGGSTASCPTSSLTVNSHTITATYTPDNQNFGAGTPASIPYTVGKASTMVSPFTSTTNPSSYLQLVTFTANVSVTPPGGGSPPGTVDFTDITDPTKPVTLCPGVALSGGQAQCGTSSLSVISHNIKATYNNTDGNYNGNFATLTQVVQAAVTTTALVSAPNPSDVNQFVLLTATINGQYGGAPTGQVTFTSDGKAISECPLPVKLNNQQQATCNTQKLAVGMHSIVAAYDPNGDVNFKLSDNTMNPLQQLVGPTPTTTTIVPSLNPSVSQQMVTFTLTVTPTFHNSTSPSGSVDLADTTDPGSPTPVAGCTGVPVPVINGPFTCSTTALQSGPRSITATYNGDPNFQRSSAMLTQTVQDFAPSVDWSPQITPMAVAVAQGYTNTTQPFNPQTITFTATSAFGFGNALSLTCSVAWCSFANTPISFVKNPDGSITATTTVIIDAKTSPPPVGTYAVTVTATDPTGLAHTAPLFVMITNTVSAINVTPGTTGTPTPVSFVAPSPQANITFSCAQILPAITGISCSFAPASPPLNPNTPTSVTVTVTASTKSAQLNVSPRILATLWLGMPAIVLIGSLRFGRLSRKKLLQMFGLMLVVIALLQGIGCGGGFVRPPAPITPGGSYQLLVEGKDTNNMVQTSAIIPINVLSQSQ